MQHESLYRFLPVRSMGRVFKQNKRSSTFKSILDIGTGTGLLSLMLAQKSGAQIHAVDIDKNSFVQASENFKASPWNERLRGISFRYKKNGKAPRDHDLIIANPPFYENDLLPRAQRICFKT